MDKEQRIEMLIANLSEMKKDIAQLEQEMPGPGWKKGEVVFSFGFLFHEPCRKRDCRSKTNGGPTHIIRYGGDSMNHVIYVKDGSIYSPYTGCIIERPAIVVSKEADTIHGYGNFEDVNAKFIKLANGYAKAGFQDDVDDLMLIELSEYQIDREMAGYVIRRAMEFTATGFIRSLCQKLTDSSDVIEWLKSEMERIPIDLSEQEWS